MPCRRNTVIYVLIVHTSLNRKKVYADMNWLNLSLDQIKFFQKIVRELMKLK